MNTQRHVDMDRPWTNEPRWKGIERPYSMADVARLRGSVHIEHTLARMGVGAICGKLLNTEPFVRALGALTGNQAVQQVQAGLKAIYLSGWQVAGDANLAGQMYPDQSLYPANSVPNVVRAINNAFQRADQIQHAERKGDTYWFAPIVADAEAGFGGPLNAFELMKAMIEAGAAGVHFEDQLASAKKCGHMGGKVLVPTQEFVQKLIAARLAADVMGVPTILIARTDADSAKLITSDADPRDREFVTGTRTADGFLQFRGGLDAAIARGLAYAPYADMIWCETSEPNLEEARRFAEAIHKQFPGKLLAYNCSPSFHWNGKLDAATIATVPGRARRDGLQVSIRHARWIPCAQPEYVRAGARLCVVGDGGVRATAGSRIRTGARWIFGGASPAVRGYRVFRRACAGDCEWCELDGCAGGVYGRSPVRLALLIIGTGRFAL